MNGQPENLDRRRLGDVVTQRIRELIARNNLQPGDRLPTELELAKQFGVSRVSIREATKALCFLGFLSATPRRGTVVSTIDFRRISRFLELHPALRHAPAQQLIASWQVLALGCVPYLCEQYRLQPALHQELLELAEAASRVHDPAARLDLECELQARLIDASGLSPLFLVRELITYIFTRLVHEAGHPSRSEQWPDLFAAWDAGHRRFLTLLQEQQAAQAEQELARQIKSCEPLLTPLPA